MIDLGPLIRKTVTDQAKAWLDEAESRVDSQGGEGLKVAFPGLARNVGKGPLGQDAAPAAPDEDGLLVDLRAWRMCDAAGAALVAKAAPDDEALVDLYRHGDFEERIACLRSLALLPITPATVELLGEIQRTNTTAHFEAGALDSNVVARAVREGGDEEGFTRADFRRLVLKMAFSDLPLARLHEGLSLADETLSRMLIDFATEREAAGRAVWVDTCRFLGAAPVDGAIPRLLGALEHGHDPLREAAAEALMQIDDPALKPWLESRRTREPRPGIRAILSA